jgi:hypothetical protein
MHAVHLRYYRENIFKGWDNRNDKPLHSILYLKQSEIDEIRKISYNS